MTDGITSTKEHSILPGIKETPKNDTLLHLADAVSVTFTVQKNDLQDKMITMYYCIGH
jgi:hypothetical protein